MLLAFGVLLRLAAGLAEQRPRIEAPSITVDAGVDGVRPRSWRTGPTGMETAAIAQFAGLGALVAGSSPWRSSLPGRRPHEPDDAIAADALAPHAPERDVVDNKRHLAAALDVGHPEPARDTTARGRIRVLEQAPRPTDSVSDAQQRRVPA